MIFEGYTLEARAEVGLLTRNIVIRGSNNPQWHDKIEACPDGFDTGEFAVQTCFQGRFGEEIGNDQFGSQIIIHSPEIDSQLSAAHIEYVEVTYAGQAFRLGRYAIHFHLNGNMSGSYVRGCSIHKSFNRAINVHNSHNVLIEHNVIYDIMGGALFTEDGIETGNVYQYNLVMFVKSSTSLLNDDITPAAYWVTNPNNVYRHNVAAGGTHFGWWYRMHQHPDGPSFTRDICPRKVAMGIFYNNTVHSQGWFGVWIFRQWTPMQGGCCRCSTPEPARFERFTAWNCEKGFEWVEGGAIQIHDSLFVNNQKAGIEAKLIISARDYSIEHGAMLNNTVIAAKPATDGIMDSSTTSLGIIYPYSRGLITDGITFINFNDAGKAGLGITQIDGKTSSFNGGFKYITRNLAFLNANNKVKWRWENEGVFHDLDGTLTGEVDGKVVPKSGILPPTCSEVQSDFSVGFAGVNCSSQVEFTRWSFNFPSPNSLHFKNCIFENRFGSVSSPWSKKRVTHPRGWMVLLVNTEEYVMTFENAGHITNISYSGTFYELEVSWFVELLTVQHLSKSCHFYMRTINILHFIPE